MIHTDWKVRHPDGREWVAFRVGTWIIDSVSELTGKSPADLVWPPAAEIAAMSPAVKRLPAGTPLQQRDR